jgi:hypothetical protein
VWRWFSDIQDDLRYRNRADDSDNIEETSEDDEDAELFK